MQLQQASRKKAKIKMALQGPSGSGKTKSALLIAFGLCQDWTKVAVIDTENHSADLYAHLGNFKTLALTAPYTPERYIQAINLCKEVGIEVLIIDSVSHEWEGSEGILDIHGSMMGNSFTNWSKVMPRHNAFVQTLLQCNMHIIATIRSKQEYVLVEKNGKQVPEKVGLKAITKEGLDYEFTLLFELNVKHQAVATKDRTGLFMDKPEFTPTIETGAHILRWCNEGINDFTTRINDCKSVEELIVLYQQSPEYQDQYAQHFSNKKHQLAQNNISKPINT